MRPIHSVAEPDQLANGYMGDEGLPPNHLPGRSFATKLSRPLATAPALVAGLVVALIAIALVWAFHLNHPAPFIPYHDTWEYIHRAEIMLSGGAWADPARMPGYPLLLAALFLFAGRGNTVAADWLQLGLFVATSVAVYVLALRLWRRVGVALIIGALFASNLYILSYVKPILSDGLALVLTVLLALALLAFLRRPSAWRLWLVTAAMLALVMTRAEWAGVPIPLYLFLLLVVGWRRIGRRLVGHALAGAGAVYGALAALVVTNRVVNGFTGLTDAENINLYGKVMQYRMQNLAPARYADVRRITDQAFAHGIHDPWVTYAHYPELGRHHFATIGAYARAIILSHPLEFLHRTVPTFFGALASDNLFAKVRLHGPFATQLLTWAHFSRGVAWYFMPCLLAGIAWWAVLLVGRRVAGRRQVAALAALTLLALYDLVVISISSYDEYSRLHLEVDPLLLVVGVGSLLWLVRQGMSVPRVLLRRRQLAAYRARRTSADERTAA